MAKNRKNEILLKEKKPKYAQVSNQLRSYFDIYDRDKIYRMITNKKKEKSNLRKQGRYGKKRENKAKRMRRNLSTYFEKKLEKNFSKDCEVNETALEGIKNKRRILRSKSSGLFF